MDKIIENSSNELPNEVKLNSDNDSNPIFDIISTLQSKLNTTPKQTTMSSNEENKSNSNDNVNNYENGFDISKLSTLFNSLGQSSSNTTTSNPVNSAELLSGLAGLNIDVSTIMRFQKIFSKLNQDDPRKNLLISLKPFLRETRQKNLDTYIILIALADAFDIFDKKDRR